MKYLLRIPYSLVSLLATTLIFSSYLSINTINSTNVGGFVDLLKGTAERPYIYRVLPPLLAKMGAHILPKPFTSMLIDLPQQNVWAKALQNLSAGKYYAEAFCVLTLMYLALAGFMLAEKLLLEKLGYPLTWQYVLPPAMAVLSLPFSVYFAYVYDLPQMFLFAVSVFLLFQKQWAAYIIILAITTLNKETSFCLILIFTLYYFNRLPRRSYYTLLTLQLATFLSLRAIIMYIYRDNPGGAIKFSLNDHFQQYIAYPPALVFTILFFGLMIFLIFKDWERKPIFLRYASLTFFLVMGLFFIGGMPMEFRIFLDVYPVFGVMLFPHNTEFLPVAIKQPD